MKKFLSFCTLALVLIQLSGCNLLPWRVVPPPDPPIKLLVAQIKMDAPLSSPDDLKSFDKSPSREEEAAVLGSFGNRAVFLTEPTVCPPTCPPEPSGEAASPVSDIVQITHVMDPRAVGFDFFSLDFLSDPNAGIGSRGPLDPPNVVETGPYRRSLHNC